MVLFFIFLNCKILIPHYLESRAHSLENETRFMRQEMKTLNDKYNEQENLVDSLSKFLTE